MGLYLVGDAYLQRPDYAGAAIDALLKVAEVERGDAVCDVGAGVAHLTLMLAARGLVVTAVEPNDAMRANGIKRTASLPDVRWHEGTGEKYRSGRSRFLARYLRQLIQRL